MTWLREPLFHFLIGGALLFGTYALLTDESAAPRESSAAAVLITANEISWLSETWERQRGSEPTGRELQGLVTDYLREELLAREARELQLDENDTVVRRRLAQKMSFFLEDTMRLAEPADDELRRIYGAHPERFRTPRRVSFSQIYFNRDTRGDQAWDDTRKALAELTKPGGETDAIALGDASLLASEGIAMDEASVAADFGAEFARAMFALPPGAWRGPIESGYGLHLVRITEVFEGKQLPFTEARGKVLESWRSDMQAAAERRYFAGLLKKYEVVVDADLVPLLGPLLAAARDAE